MKVVQCTCTYCNFKWEPYILHLGRVYSDKLCPKCQDKKIEKYEYEKIDYYSGQGSKEKLWTND